MSVNDAKHEAISPKNLGETDSARKRRLLDNSARKSWSLTDKQTDQEVLLEMGVSLLESDDGDTNGSGESSTTTLKSNSKRILDVENINPNVNSAPLSKGSPKWSPKGLKCFSPVAGPSYLSSPAAEDCVKPNQELRCANDEETPEGQLAVSEVSKARSTVFGTRHTPVSERKRPFKPLGVEEDIIQRKRTKSELEGPDTFHGLSDEVLLCIFKWLPKRSLAHCMLVCKRWHRVACDETFWQRLELGNRTLKQGALGIILARKPIIVRLAGSEIGEWHPTSAAEPSRIQYLDLSMVSTDKKTIACLLERCSSLRKLSLEGVPVDDYICELIGRCSRMETLNLTMAAGITVEGLRCILEGCPDLQSLNISWCNLCSASLKLLGTSAPQRLTRLNIAGSRLLTDDMAKALAMRCPRLLELDVSDCAGLGASGLNALLKLTRLEHLALSRCYLLPPQALTKVGSLPSLQYLEVWGLLHANSLSALRAALPGLQLNQFMHSAIARPTVGTRRTSIWGLKTRD